MRGISKTMATIIDIIYLVWGNTVISNRSDLFHFIFFPRNSSFLYERDWSAVKRNPMRIARSIDDFPARLRSSFTRLEYQFARLLHVANPAKNLLFQHRLTLLMLPSCGI
jgi:hypothetical protein